MKTFDVDPITAKFSDSGLLAIMCLWVGLGLCALFSASYYFGSIASNSPFYFFYRQLLWILIGSLFAFIAYRINIKRIRALSSAFFFIAVLLNLGTFIPALRVSSGGASRWIGFGGFTLQPSEIMRVAIVLYLANMFDKRAEDGQLNDLINGVLPAILSAFFVAFLVYMQNDFSSSAYIFALFLVMMYVGGIHYSYIIYSFGVLGISSFFMIIAKPYRKERISSWLDPSSDPTGAGYQLLKSRQALEQGHLLGLGFGKGQLKLGYLPAAHSDFVFAVVGEETGFLGVFLIIALFTLFAIKGYSIALKGDSPYVRLMALGLTSSVMFQVMINLAVVVGLIPPTGIPLPLFSSGGTSTIMTLIVFGLLLNLSQYCIKDEKEIFSYD